MIITTIDSVVEMFKDYCGVDEIPPDAQAVKLLFKPTERGRLAIVMESPSWQTGGQMEVRFEIKRFHPIGGSQ
jgi:hypothetical protein